MYGWLCLKYIKDEQIVLYKGKVVKEYLKYENKGLDKIPDEAL